jgi:hypothetical protein
MPAVGVPAQMRRKPGGADVRIKARDRTRPPTFVPVDKSGSMGSAIEVGKRTAAMIWAASSASRRCSRCRRAGGSCGQIPAGGVGDGRTTGGGARRWVGRAA